jgi:cytosine/adenosine deaminase-related metal-dependent hydrolase
VTASVLVCGAVLDGVSEELRGPTEILVRDGLISEVGDSVDRLDGGEVVDLSERTVSPGFIDSHVYLTMDASNLAQQTLESSATKALKGLSIAREYLRYGFTTLRDLGSMDPKFPTVDLRNALNAGLVWGPAADRRRPHHQRVRRPRRPPRLLRLALGSAGVRDWRRHRGDSAAGAPRARLRLGLDQDRSSPAPAPTSSRCRETRSTTSQPPPASTS